MLLGVKVPITTALREQRFVCTALDNLSGFDHKNLVFRKFQKAKPAPAAAAPAEGGEKKEEATA